MMEPVDIQRAKPAMLSAETHARVLANNAALTTPRPRIRVSPLPAWLLLIVCFLAGWFLKGMV